MDTRRFRDAFLVIGTFLLCLILVWVVSCTDVNQIVEPTSVDVNVSTPSGTVETGTGGTPPAPGDNDPVSLVFEPPSITAPSGTSVVVQVIALNQAGQEIPSVSLTVIVSDSSVATVKDIDGRFVSFSLVSAGVTSAIVTAAGAQAQFVITVT
jgi:hypothetical protein